MPIYSSKRTADRVEHIASKRPERESSEKLKHRSEAAAAAAGRNHIARSFLLESSSMWVPSTLRSTKVLVLSDCLREFVPPTSAFYLAWRNTYFTGALSVDPQGVFSWKSAVCVPSIVPSQPPNDRGFPVPFDLRPQRQYVNSWNCLAVYCNVSWQSKDSR